MNRDPSTELRERAELAYEKLLPELRALRPRELTSVNLDIASAVATVLRAYPRIVKLARRISRELPEFDVRRARRLNEYAFALIHAQALYIAPSERGTALQSVVNTALEHRELLLGDARALIRHGLLDGDTLCALKGVNGYKNIANDLRFLATLFREHFASIQGRSPIEIEDLQRADELADQILSTLQEREHPAPEVIAAADMRARAFTLLVRSYDQARRAITYLRWNERDADTIAPSLYAARGRRVRMFEAMEERAPKDQ